MQFNGVAERLSRELLVVCSPDGTCIELDERASRVLGVVPGQRIDALVELGSANKWRSLLERASREPVRDWEIFFMVGGEPALYAVNAQSSADGIVLVATSVCPGHAQALAAGQLALDDLSQIHREEARQKAQLEKLNRELVDAQQGLASLYAELDEKNDTLRRSADLKSRLVANVSHEFRTPINSILGLTRLLLDRVDGDLSAEQELQVQFVRQNAETLGALVDDVLDLSKIEAGKVPLRPRTFEVTAVFAALRGAMRALQNGDRVTLVVDDGAGLPPMQSDDAKVAQVLRNLVSNALKFTEEGQVRVFAERGVGDTIVFRVADTGIGIDKADHAKIFEEFVQVESERQRTHKGTGLGLSVSRHLATLLGGTLSVESELGRGATFSLTVPRVHVGEQQMRALLERSRVLDPRCAPVLVVEDDRQTMFLYEKYLAPSGLQVIPARTTDEARAALQRVRPAAIVLDVMLGTETSWRFLREIKGDPGTSKIPVIVVTVVDSSLEARALGADECWLKPVDPERIGPRLIELAKRGPAPTLLVDDDLAACGGLDVG